MYRRGIVSAVDAPTHRVRVKCVDLQDLESPWLDVLVRDAAADKEYSLPAEGAQVGCLMADDGSSGCVLGAVYSEVDAPAEPKNVNVRHWTFADGAKLGYDREAHKLTIELPADGNLEVQVGGLVKVTAEGDVELLPGGLLKVAGAADFVALAQKVDDGFAQHKSELDTLKNELAAHTHGSAWGPTAPPLGPFASSSAVPSVKCRKLKTD